MAEAQTVAVEGIRDLPSPFYLPQALIDGMREKLAHNGKERWWLNTGGAIGCWSGGSMAGIGDVDEKGAAMIMDDELQIHVYGVGHGDCQLVELKQGGLPRFRMLYDGGKSAGNHIDKLAAYLTRNRRIEGPDIDVVVLSHVDHDHQGGLHTLANQAGLRIGEYWGPCLPAFRRLTWLFSQRVQNAVARADELERLMSGRGARVIYPMEGYAGSWMAGKVNAAVISPPVRLLKRLLRNRREDLRFLADPAGPTPLEWLIAPTETDAELDEGPGGELERRTFSVPSDFDDEPIALPVEPNPATGFYRDEVTEPNFFGNRLLNNTSLVIALDVWLDGKRRRRILLTGDQENWSYIASRYPAGLGVDVLKVPHHGGMVYLADRKDGDQDDRDAGVVEQTYLWLKPRIAIVSAQGTYDLPHSRMRDALRATDTAILCTNIRGVERIVPPSSDLRLERSCYDVFDCGMSEQPQVTVLTLTSGTEKMDRAACVSRSEGRGVAPIVVMTQRVVDPDEAFVRWTQTELERHAIWVKDLLGEARAVFMDAVVGKGPLVAMECVPVGWRHIETHARASGRHHFLASPYEALHYARARGFIWVSAGNLRYPDDVGFYVLPSRKELDAIWSWVASMPNILLRATLSKAAIVGNDKLSILNSADTDILCRLIAAKICFPVKVVKTEIMPQIFLRMTESFSFRICNEAYPYRAFGKDCWGNELLWLQKDRGANVSVPDLFDDDWQKHLFSGYIADRENLEFFLSEAQRSAFVGPVLCANGEKLLIQSGAFGSFEREYEYGENERIAGVFRDRFERAGWLTLP
ncbi:ComEC/Rec2 family competence protein [Burkholderia lata]|uniref:ComEC/Rec2 family competence protein n=1 Tax=Burkholderia lata (strain ATCC 17760 / DSM 23089 / LMG 22485 / NCIMB 9086 / R18194 / 383) TaxID=482957 RepID=UPI001583EF8E|nr:MBL fold metallo-hydrolase [Burkholderia lata]